MASFVTYQGQGYGQGTTTDGEINGTLKFVERTSEFPVRLTYHLQYSWSKGSFCTALSLNCKEDIIGLLYALIKACPEEYAYVAMNYEDKNFLKGRDLPTDVVWPPTKAR